MSGLFCHFYSILLSNNVELDQTSHDVASDLGLHCLPLTFKITGFSQLIIVGVAKHCHWVARDRVVLRVSSRWPAFLWRRSLSWTLLMYPFSTHAASRRAFTAGPTDDRKTYGLQALDGRTAPRTAAMDTFR